MPHPDASRLVAACMEQGYVVLADRPGLLPTERLTSPAELPADATEVWILPPEPVPRPMPGRRAQRLSGAGALRASHLGAVRLRRRPAS